MEGKPPIVVVTGGPCGGKSTFMVRVRQRLEKFGYHALVVSETATELITAGASPAVIGLKAFQQRLLQYSLTREQHYRDIAELIPADKVVILCDRGVIDCCAYMGTELYTRMLLELGYSHSELMHRYDLVIHLVTAARGAEAYYTLANNSAREESPEEARLLDAKTATAWLGHPHHIMVDNSTSFERKMKRALSALSRKLDMPAPTEIERKFWIHNLQPGMIPAGAVASRITQDYLTCAGPGERRVRKRVAGDQASYFYTEKLPTAESTTRIEKERAIDQEEYRQFLANERDPNLLTIEKVRHNFPYDGRVYELDVFEGKHAGLVVLEVELQDANDEVVIPQGWEAFEVTDDKRFKNRQLAESSF
jgi:CYTH domain-containing protein/thymidylate kinase